MILAVGHASYDITMAVDSLFGGAEKQKARQLVRCGGGPAANGAVTAARMGGIPVALSAYLGGPLFGRAHSLELEAEGISLAGCVGGEDEIPLSIILTEPGGKRRLVNYREESSYLEWDDLSGVFREDLPQPQVLLFDGHEPLLACRWLDHKPTGTVSLLDAGSHHRGTEALWREVDYLAASWAFTEHTTGAIDPAQGCLALSREREGRGPTLVTDGEEGLWWCDPPRQGEPLHCPAFHVEAKDTTGAGDVFHGMMAWCLASQIPWKETVALSSAAAALCCRRQGARSSIPTRQELREFLLLQGFNALGHLL